MASSIPIHLSGSTLLGDRIPKFVRLLGSCQALAFKQELEIRLVISLPSYGTKMNSTTQVTLDQ
jgi:hypothetical protein